MVSEVGHVCLDWIGSSDKQVDVNVLCSVFVGRSGGAGNCQTIRLFSVPHLNLGECDFTNLLIGQNRKEYLNDLKEYFKLYP